MKSYLILRLKAPFQSYGTFGKWEYRDSSIFPTKSALVGLFGCALGISKGNKELEYLCDNLKISIRGDRISSQLVDYQIARGAHIKAEDILVGKGNSNPDELESKICRKEYMEDSAYTVFVEGELSLLERLNDAIQNPVWSYSLGRANCICSRPIYASKDENGIISSDLDIIEIMKQVPLIAKSKTDTIFVEVEVLRKDLKKYPKDLIVESLTSTGKYVGADYRKYYAYRGYIDKQEIVEEGAEIVHK